MTEVLFRTDMGVSLIETWGSDKKVAQAARVSTQGLDNDREKFIGLVRALLTAKPAPHWSPFEHSGMTIAFEVPLFIRSQIIRHKSMALSEFSMRYSVAKPDFWLAPKDRPLVQSGRALDYHREQGTKTQRNLVKHYLRNVAEVTWDSYQAMVDAGITLEVARVVLPQSTYTQMWFSGNLRSWIHFMEARWEKHAQAEVQEVGKKVADIFEKNYPITYAAWKELS